MREEVTMRGDKHRKRVVIKIELGEDLYLFLHYSKAARLPVKAGMPINHAAIEGKKLWYIALCS